MPYLFPDNSNFPKGIDGTTIYGGSIGSNRIFHYLRENASQFNIPKWDLYLINIFTLVRNCYQKGMTQDQLEQVLDHESDTYMTYIGAYMSYKRITPSLVFFYAPDYSAVPEKYMRLHTGNQAEIDGMYKKLYQKLPPIPMELTQVPETRKFISRVGKTLFPHKDLIEKIRTIYSGRRISGSLGTVMISHCPIDFHLYKAIPDIQLLESYTGSILTSSDFGQKLTKDVKIPFNTTTHRLFGDSLQLDPLIKGRDRTKLIEIATDQNWYVKTESEIISSTISKFPNILPSELSILRL